MEFRIVNSRPWIDENGIQKGTIYTVFCNDEEETTLVEVTVAGDNGSIPVEPEPIASSEAYAAFVRLYLDWMEMSEEEQIELTRKSVKSAGYIFKKYTRMEGIPFTKTGHEMCGEEFDGYVNEAWASLGEHFSEVDAFALYMEQNFKKYSKFPMAGDMLRRAAQNMMSKMREEQISASKYMHIDSTVNCKDGKEVSLAELITDNSVDVEDPVSFDAFVDNIRTCINKNQVRLQIFDLLIKGYKQSEIAKMIVVKDNDGKEKTISPAAVSKHVKKIREIINNINT